MTTNARPPSIDRAARRRTIKRRATAASLGVLLAVFGAVAAGDLSRERGAAPAVAAPVVTQTVPTTGQSVQPSAPGGAPVVRQPLRVRTRQS
jgi:hypothetical protein